MKRFKLLPLAFALLCSGAVVASSGSLRDCMRRRGIDHKPTRDDGSDVLASIAANNNKLPRGYVDRAFVCQATIALKLNRDEVLAVI